MKGQYFSFDAVIGASIFILTLVAIMSYWYGVSGSIEQQQSMLAKEAIRIADILYSPVAVPYGVAFDWNDRRLSLEKVDSLCYGGVPPREAMDSQYEVAMEFNTRTAFICDWPIDTEIEANEIYKLRRVATFVDEDGDSETGYVDIYVYVPIPAN
ncbi:hypothetical protein JW721_02790 [Candidatus Micrarchaeota archaeon]|nr:hypothetical protein [Candidatus Micrarchaeota archaeon]